MKLMNGYQARAYTDALSAGSYDIADAEIVAKRLLAAGYPVPDDARGSRIDTTSHALDYEPVSTAGQQPEVPAEEPIAPEDED